jgi:Tat protein secretion system quality control protein TatD with DNase activity
MLVLLAVLAGCASSPPTEGPLEIIDAHVHLNDEAMQLALMDEYGVARAVVFWGRNSDNAKILAAVERRPTRFIPFASVSPERSAYRAQWARDDPAILAELGALLASGSFKGIGEISVAHEAAAGFAATDFSPTSQTMLGIMALARRHRVPVMVHCEITRIAELEEMLRRFPEVAVIWAHGGYSDAATARRVLQGHPNLYYELSARTWPRHPRSADYPIVQPDGTVQGPWLALVESMPGRFLVGTDASLHVEANERMKIESVKRFLAALSPPARRAVAAGTLIKLLGEKSP